MQNHYNLCYREEEREMIPLCKDQGIGLIPWSPLAKGFLAGKYKRGESPSSKRYQSDAYLRSNYFHPNDFDILDQVVAIAKEKGATPAQTALAWMLRKGVAAPIVGVTRTEQLEELVGAIEVQLTDDDVKRLEENYQPHPIIGHF
jgi:aryl-alcohol dehydrogenase (NADP+)